MSIGFRKNFHVFPDFLFSSIFEKAVDKRIFSVIIGLLCESAGIGRQARLRCVCRMTCEFKSHLSHQKNTGFGRCFFGVRDEITSPAMPGTSPPPHGGGVIESEGEP